MTDPHDRDGILASATDRLLASAGRLTDTQVREPSLLPSWTRGHVLAHLARNADALRNLVTWARSGVVTPDYPSREQRDAEIERDASRPAAEHHRDLAESSAALADDLRGLPRDALETPLTTYKGVEAPASRLAWMRFREVEIHHVDLDAGYASSSWPQPFVARCLDDVVEMFAGRADTPSVKLQGVDTQREWELGGDPGTDTEPPTVAGPERELLAWLLQRNDGDELAVQPAGALPRPPAWT